MGTRAAIQLQWANLQGTGSLLNIEQSPSGACDKLVARWNFLPGGSGSDPGQDFVDTWEFFANEHEKDVLQSDTDVVRAFNEDDFATAKAMLQDPASVKPLSTAVNNLFSSGAKAAGAETLMRLMFGGFTSARIFQPIIRHTQTVTNQWTIPAAQTNVKKIISTASLISLEAIPNHILFQLPNGFSTKADFSYGWYKKFPTTRTAARQRTQLEQEWEYGLWPILIVGTPL
jgi:hypothetical protein